MKYKYCQECGTELIQKELNNDGLVPYCPHCQQFRFPLYNVAVIMIVVNESNGKILLIKQYGRDSYILVAGYINRGESAEETVARELQEETGMTPSRIQYNRTEFYEGSNSLMCNYTVFVKDDSQFNTNHEIDSSCWFTPEEAKENIRHGSLAEKFLLGYLAAVED